MYILEKTSANKVSCKKTSTKTTYAQLQLHKKHGPNHKKPQQQIRKQQKQQQQQQLIAIAIVWTNQHITDKETASNK